MNWFAICSDWLEQTHIEWRTAQWYYVQHQHHPSTPSQSSLMMIVSILVHDSYEWSSNETMPLEVMMALTLSFGAMGHLTMDKHLMIIPPSVVALLRPWWWSTFDLSLLSPSCWSAMTTLIVRRVETQWCQVGPKVGWYMSGPSWITSPYTSLGFELLDGVTWTIDCYTLCS